MAERYVLDTSAILTLTDQEEGADRVEGILKLAGQGGCRVEICAASLMEVYYITLQGADEDQAGQLLGLVKSWPIHWAYPDEKTLLTAARLKAFHRLSFADAQIAATARNQRAHLVHKDPEFLPLADEIVLLTLPLKSKPAAKSFPKTARRLAKSAKVGERSAK